MVDNNALNATVSGRLPGVQAFIRKTESLVAEIEVLVVAAIRMSPLAKAIDDDDVVADVLADKASELLLHDVNANSSKTDAAIAQ